MFFCQTHPLFASCPLLRFSWSQQRCLLAEPEGVITRQADFTLPFGSCSQPTRHTCGDETFTTNHKRVDSARGVGPDSHWKRQMFASDGAFHYFPANTAPDATGVNPTLNLSWVSTGYIFRHGFSSMFAFHVHPSKCGDCVA